MSGLKSTHRINWEGRLLKRVERSNNKLTTGEQGVITPAVWSTLQPTGRGLHKNQENFPTIMWLEMCWHVGLF